MSFGERRELLHPGHEFIHHPGALDTLIARMQRRELDRDSWPLVDAAAVGGAADGVDGALVFVEIAPGVFSGHRRFAQHVVGERETPRFPLMGVLKRLLDRAA